MKSTMTKSENDDLAIVIPNAMAFAGLLLACTLLFAHATRKRRRGERRRASVLGRRHSNDEESVDTTMGVYNGIAGAIGLGAVSRDYSNGERTRLLDNSDVVKYDADTKHCGNGSECDGIERR